MEVEKSLRLGLDSLEWILSRIKQIWTRHKILRIVGYTTAVLTTHYTYTKWYRKRHKIPDGPVGFPLLGILPYYCMGGTYHPTSFAKYGPLTFVQLPMRSVVIVNHPKLMKKLTNTYEVNDRPPDWPDIIIPNSLKATTGPHWKYHRTVFLKWVRRRSTVDTFRKMWKKDFNAYVKPLLIDKAKRNESVALYPSFVSIHPFNVFFKGLTGVDLNECNDVTNATKLYLLDCVDRMGAFWKFAIGPYLCQYLNRPFTKSGLDLIEKYCDRYCGAENENDTNTDNNSKSFIPMARFYFNEIERTKGLECGNDEKLTRVDLFAEGFELFFAEATLREPIQIGLLILAKYQSLQQSVFEELNSVFDNDPSAFEYTPKNRSKIPQFRAMILEMLRIAATNEGIVRQVSGYANGGLKIDWDGREYLIPNGTTITPNMFYFTNCVAPYTREVNLNHWLNHRGEYRPIIQHPHFGTGGRSCVGRQLGEMGLRYLFGQLLLNFKVIPVDGNTDFEIPVRGFGEMSVTIVPRTR